MRTRAPGKKGWTHFSNTTGWPRNPTTRNTPRKKKNIIQQDFIAALFTTARTWQWPRCPSTEECGKEGAVHAQNRLLLSRKRECSGSLAESWLDLETITERGKNQKEENISHIMNVCVCNLERWYR